MGGHSLISICSLRENIMGQLDALKLPLCVGKVWEEPDHMQIIKDIQKWNNLFMPQFALDNFYELLWIFYSITKNTMKNMKEKNAFPRNGGTPLSHIKILVMDKVNPSPSTKVIHSSSTKNCRRPI